MNGPSSSVIAGSLGTEGGSVRARNERLTRATGTIRRNVILDGGALGCRDVGALRNGDSAFGCRQMLGNVREWTADTFRPLDDSESPFDRTKVLRGGAWATRGRLLTGRHVIWCCRW